MADKQHGPAFLADVLHLAETFLLELSVADRQDLIDHQDIGLYMRSYRERQPYVHATRIALDRCIEKFLDFGEGHDLVELPGDLCLAHSQDRAIEVNVFASSKFGMEAGAHLEEARQ